MWLIRYRAFLGKSLHRRNWVQRYQTSVFDFTSSSSSSKSCFYPSKAQQAVGSTIYHIVRESGLLRDAQHRASHDAHRRTTLLRTKNVSFWLSETALLCLIEGSIFGHGTCQAWQAVGVRMANRIIAAVRCETLHLEGKDISVKVCS